MIFREVECCNCGVCFGVSPTLDNNWRETKKTFYCPNGHSQSYTKSTAQLLQEKLERKERELSEKDKQITLLSKPPKKVTKRKKVAK